MNKVVPTSKELAPYTSFSIAHVLASVWLRLNAFRGVTDLATGPPVVVLSQVVVVGRAVIDARYGLLDVIECWFYGAHFGIANEVLYF